MYLLFTGVMQSFPGRPKYPFLSADCRYDKDWRGSNGSEVSDQAYASLELSTDKMNLLQSSHPTTI